MSGERDEARERESGRGMAGLHKGGGREGKQDSQDAPTKANPEARGWQKGCWERKLNTHPSMAGRLGSGGKGDGLTLHLVRVRASMRVRERAGQKTEAPPLHIKGGEREDLLSRGFAVLPPIPPLLRTLLGKPALLLLARRQHTAWWLRVCEAC